MLSRWFKQLIRWCLIKCYKVEVNGLEHLEQLEEKTIIVANHTSYLDALLLYAFLPIKLTFAINTFVAQGWVLRLIKNLIELFPMDPTNPLSMRRLIKRVDKGGHVVIYMTTLINALN